MTSATEFVSTETCFVAMYANVLSIEESHELLRELAADLEWKVETDDFGPQSRPTCYYADSPECVFTYVGLRLNPSPWPKTLMRLKERVAQACQLDPSLLTACLVNHYQPNEGFIPWHYDEIRAHGPSKTVASLSLGGPRRFQMRTRTGDKDVLPSRMVADLLVPSGSVILMQGETQAHYEHCLPLENDQAPHRISLTFRSIVPGWEQGKEIATDVCCINDPYKQ